MSATKMKVYVLLQIVDEGLSYNGWEVVETQIIGVFTTQAAALAMQASWPDHTSRIEAHDLNAD